MFEREVIEALGELHTAKSPLLLIEWSLNRLSRRFGSDFAVWTQFGPAGTMRSAMLREDASAEAWKYGPVIQRHAASDHLGLRRYLQAGSAWEAGKLTDHSTQTAFERTALFREGYRHLGMRRQLFAIFKDSRGGVCSFAFGRNGSDFTAEQAESIALLAPHFQLALERLWQIQALEEAAEAGKAGQFHALQIDGEWHYKLITDAAAQLMLGHFGGEETFMVPGRLARHFAQAAAMDEQRVTDLNGSQWLMRVAAVALGEVAVTLTKASDILSAHNLTLREAEVLNWICEGKRDAEIATILDISSRTVSKHVQRILDKLGAETRSGAAAILAGARA